MVEFEIINDRGVVTKFRFTDTSRLENYSDYLNTWQEYHFSDIWEHPEYVNAKRKHKLERYYER